MRLLARSPTNKRPAGTKGRPWGGLKLAGGVAFLAPGFEERAVFGKLHHASVGVAAVPVGDEDIAVGSEGHRRGLIEHIGAVAGDALLAEGEQDFAVRIELDDLMPAAVGDPDVAIAIDHQVMREKQHAGAEALKQLAG